MMSNQRFSSIWDAITDNRAERANLKMRADLMVHISQIIKQNGWTQAQASKYCGISQSQIKNLLQGDITQFSLDTLVNINATLGQAITLNFSDEMGLLA